MHGCFTAQPGQGGALAEILLAAAEGLRADDSCLLYVVSREGEDKIWVTEVWTDREAHDASLRAPGVPEMIDRARPLISSIEDRAEFTPLGGKGV
jgi:quinol monooxygenase YgiN